MEGNRGLDITIEGHIAYLCCHVEGHIAHLCCHVEDHIVDLCCLF